MIAASATSPSPDRYSKEFLAGWGTMDFNGHLANRAYLDLAADVRLAFFAEHGFPPTEFRRLSIGPVMKKDELEYFHEIGIHETVTVTYAVRAMSADGSRFILENEIWSASGERAATVRSTRAAGSICALGSSSHQHRSCSRRSRRSRGRPTSRSCSPPRSRDG